MKLRIAAVLCVLACSAHGLLADVRADEKTRVEFGGMLGRMVNFFGGKAAKEGVVSTAAVKGDRKMTTTGQNGQIVDLAEEKIYDLDLKKKSYKVTTFAEIRRQMEEAQKRAQEDAKKQDSGGAGDSSPANPNEPQMEVDVDVKDTGATKAINGFDTRQVILTITLHEKGKTVDQSGGMITTTDMWLAPKIAAMQELAAFDLRYAQKLYGGVFGVSPQQMAAAMALYPMMKQALGQMGTEAAKIDGTAIMTTITMDAVKSAEQMAAEAQSAEQPSAPPASLGGFLGGLAKKAAAKKPEENSARSTFMTSTNEVLKVATEVSASDLAIPEGFKESK
jgi:hypothetical protein